MKPSRYTSRTPRSLWIKPGRIPRLERLEQRDAPALDFAFALGVGGEGNDSSGNIASDPSGNVVVAAGATGTNDYDPGPGVFNLTSAGGMDVLLGKYSANGNLIWAFKIGGTGDDTALSVTTDQQGNIYVGGAFQGTVDFDPGLGTTLFTSNGASDIFLAKYTSAGGLAWARQMGGTGDDYASHGLEVDSAGNVYAITRFSGTVDFDPLAGTNNIASAGSYDMAVVKLNS
ncbi:MAG: hypothetical protein U0840_29325, partial [Gemmataceae bacterium]